MEDPQEPTLAVPHARAATNPVGRGTLNRTFAAAAEAAGTGAGDGGRDGGVFGRGQVGGRLKRLRERAQNVQ